MYKWIEKVDSNILLEILGDLMSNISEECYSANWYLGSEFIIPALCLKAEKAGSPRPWARGEITSTNASLLIAIATEIGGWANLNEGATKYIKFNPFPTPEKYLQEIEFWKNKRK